MGDIADMMINGFLDCETGEMIDGDSPGYPRSNSRRNKPRGGVGDQRCGRCGKRFKTQQGVDDHIRDVHSGRVRVNGQLKKMTRNKAEDAGA